VPGSDSVRVTARHPELVKELTQLARCLSSLPPHAYVRSSCTVRAKRIGTAGEAKCDPLAVIVDDFLKQLDFLAPVSAYALSIREL
jgi:hypothetical protein